MMTSQRSRAGRPQRASARAMNDSAAASSHAILNDTEVTPTQHTEEPFLHSNAALDLQEGHSIVANGNGKRDKGKAREIDTIASWVKEEPKSISLDSPEPAIGLASAPPMPGNRSIASASLLNEDHCSACHSQGALVYCDGCPRAFHFWCLDPPMEASDLPEGDSIWFCPSCTIRKVRVTIDLSPLQPH
jgi:PHD-finger